MIVRPLSQTPLCQPPLCAHAHAPNRDRRPGNRPRRRSRGMEWGQGSSSRPRAWRQTFFLMAAPAAVLGPRVGSRLPIAPPVTARRRRPRPGPAPPPPLPWPAGVGKRTAAPMALDPAAGALRRTRPPLPAPEANPETGTPYPPWSRCPVRKFFQKIIPGNGKSTPRVMGPGPQKFQPNFGPGDNPEGQAHRYPLKKRVHASVACWRFDPGVSPGLRELSLEVLSASDVG